MTIATWVMIMTFWGDAIMSQEFTSKETCMAAGQAIKEEKGRSIVFVCMEK